MSQYVPDWTVEDDSRFFGDLLPVPNQKLSTGAEDELIELLWQNGHVVMHSQTQRRNLIFDEFKQVQKPEQVQILEQSIGNSSTLVQDDDDASWFQYPLGDSLDKAFCSEFFEMGGTDVYGSNKISKDTIAGQERLVKFGACNDGTLGMSSAPDHCTVSEKIPLPNPQSNILNSPREASCLENDGVLNFSHFTRSTKVDLESSSSRFCNEGSASGIKVRAQEPSMITVGSSNCGSNQVQSHVDHSFAFSNDTAGGPAGPSGEDGRICLPTDTEMINGHETTTTSSSGGSGFSIGRSVQQSQSNQSQKRKRRDVEDLECQSEDAGHGKRITKKPTQRSISTRRSRATEVHNLSERRRRDRINEKMKALQELLPHCNKADKASMLDEAIEYLKTLQLQVQMMWMGGGMAAPMMFPGMQQYMSAIGMGMAPASLPSMANAVQMARIPYVNQNVATAPARNQTPIYPSPSIPAVNFSNSVQGIHHPNPYAYLCFPHFQPQVQQNQPAVAACGSSLTNAGGRASSKGENRSG